MDKQAETIPTEHGLVGAAKRYLEALDTSGPSPDWRRTESELQHTELPNYLARARKLAQWIATQVVHADGVIVADFSPFGCSDAFQGLIDELHSISTFSLVHKGDGAERYRKIAARFCDHAMKIISQLSTWAGSHSALDGATSQVLDEQRRVAEDHLERIVENRQATDEAVRSARALMDEVRSASAISAIDESGDAFYTAASENDRAAKRWLVATVAGLLTSGVLAWLLTASVTEDVDVRSLEWVPEFLQRLALLSLAAWATTKCSGMFSANYHNAAVNRHRWNILATIHRFREAPKTSEGVRDSILLEASRAVSQHLPTGYLGKSSEPPAPPAQIGDVVHSPGLSPADDD